MCVCRSRLFTRKDGAPVLILLLLLMLSGDKDELLHTILSPSLTTQTHTHTHTPGLIPETVCNHKIKGKWPHVAQLQYL